MRGFDSAHGAYLQSPLSLTGIKSSVWFSPLKEKVKVEFLPVMLQGDSREVVAVKVVGKKTLNKASTENLLTEIEILKTMRHPHIVQLKDFQVSSFVVACIRDVL